jgi:hypothetical protein
MEKEGEEVRIKKMIKKVYKFLYEYEQRRTFLLCIGIFFSSLFVYPLIDVIYLTIFIILFFVMVDIILFGTKKRKVKK